MYRETGAQYDVRVRMHAPSIQKGQMAVRLIADFNADMDLDGSPTKPKRQVGRVKSVTADAIVIVTSTHGFKDKEVHISFKHINKIELLTKKKSSREQAIAIIVFFPVILFLIWYNRLQFD